VGKGVFAVPTNSRGKVSVGTLRFAHPTISKDHRKTWRLISGVSE
jgi:hypothetical protein